MPLVSEVELARALKRDLKSVHVAVEKGRVTQRPDGLFDKDQALKEWAETTQHEKGHNNYTRRAKTEASAAEPVTVPEIPTPELPLPGEIKSTAYAKARAGTQIYEALLKKLRYEERARNLTPTADVESARFTEFRTLREACFNIPSRISALLAVESDAARCQVILEDELRSVFTAYADGKLAA